jgi:hypothetical protein
MLRALLGLAVAGFLLVGGPVLDFDVARAQDGHGPVLPPPKNPFCKDCWDQLDRYTQAWNELNALRQKQQAADAKYEAFKAKFGGAWGSTPEQGAEAAEIRGEQQSLDKDIAVKKAALERAWGELQRCNARKCFEDRSLTPVPPAWFEANEPCAACRPLATQAAYLKLYVKSLQTTFADVERAAAKAFDRKIEAQVAANEAKQASQKDVGDVKKFQEAENAKKDAKELQEQFRKLKGQADALEQALAGASALLTKLEEELEACRKQHCPPKEPSTAQPPGTPTPPETPAPPKKRMVCPACERQAWKLEGLETDLRVKERGRLALKTTIDLYGKHKDDGTLSPVNQISLNDAVERLPEVEQQIRELEAKVRDARTALEKCITDKCTDKPVATDTPTGKTEQRRTERNSEERKTEERKTEQRKTEERKTERKTEERKTEERRTSKKETGRTALRSGEDKTTSVPRISVTIGLGGSSDRGHRHENHHRGGGDGGGRGGGGFGFGGSSPGAISFGR